MARTTKTRTKPSPNGENLPKRVQNLEIENASMKADKVGWREGLRTLAASLIFMISVMGGAVGFVYAELKGEIKILEVMVEKTHEIAINNAVKLEQTREIALENARKIEQTREIAIENSKKLDLLLILNQAGTGADNATTTDETPVSAPSNTDTPNNPTNPTPILLNPTPTPQETHHVPL